MAFSSGPQPKRISAQSETKSSSEQAPNSTWFWGNTWTLHLHVVYFDFLGFPVGFFLGASLNSFFRASIEGAKKSPPPVGITQSFSSRTVTSSPFGSLRGKNRTRLPSLLFVWPRIGSCPEPGSLKLGLFTQFLVTNSN